MFPLTAQEIIAATGARVVGGPPPSGPLMISTDSRTLQPGEVFLALAGPSFDGHDFVAAAFERSAAAAIVARPEAETRHCLLVVEDTLAALGRLAAWHRSRFALPVVAVTGSTGKTTTKELVHAILSPRGPVLKTAENYNNEIGVPLAALGLAPQHTAAVFELAMRQPGEIRYLASVVRPTVAVITNTGHSHLERLGSLEAIADAKGELLDELTPLGVAVLNADDAQFSRLQARVRSRLLTFSLAGPADVYAGDARPRPDLGTDFTLVTPDGQVAVSLPLPGRHNLANALAAAAAALAAGASLEQVAVGLAASLPVQGRLHLRTTCSGATVIDDCYNASPSSMRMALELLQGLPGGPKAAVLGDMKELGESAPELHREIGALLPVSGVEHLVALGPLARHYLEGAGNLPAGACWTEDLEEAARLACQALSPGAVILVKGSRAMRMEHIVEQLLDH